MLYVFIIMFIITGPEHKSSSFHPRKMFEFCPKIQNSSHRIHFVSVVLVEGAELQRQSQTKRDTQGGLMHVVLKVMNRIFVETMIIATL